VTWFNNLNIIESLIERFPVKYIFLALLLISCSKIQKINSDDYKLKQYADDFAYIIYDVKNDKIVASENSHKNLVPASLFKLFTNFAALEILGYDKKFTTKLYIVGKYNNDVLEGDVLIKGDGDPTFFIENLYNFAFALKQKGITKVNGDLLYYDHDFLNLAEINEKQTVNALYNPSLSGLNLNFNSVRVNKTDDEIKLFPNNEAVTIQSSKRKYHSPYYKSNTWFISNIDQDISLPVKQSSYFFASTLKTVFENVGIKVEKVKRSSVLPLKAELIAEYNSKTVKEIVKDGLVYSNNLYSEALLVHVAKAIECNYNELETAAICLKEWYQKNYPEINLKDARFFNGSGLDENIKISPDSVLELLKIASEKKYGQDFFVTMLPLSDYSGTMKDRFNGNSIKVFAKTGGMDFISSIAGYYYDINNSIIFVFISNNKILRDGISKRTVSSGMASKWRTEINQKHEQVLQLYLK
jgi:D-alanyl-D-alanine carboxypeptidase/D-alanyl-D-alanine-endopeptidase (penicillin-binding protein 4)